MEDLLGGKRSRWKSVFCHATCHSKFVYCVTSEKTSVTYPPPPPPMLDYVFAVIDDKQRKSLSMSYLHTAVI